jgi:hypothetical protein
MKHRSFDRYCASVRDFITAVMAFQWRQEAEWRAAVAILCFRALPANARALALAALQENLPSPRLIRAPLPAPSRKALWCHAIAAFVQEPINRPTKYTVIA